MSFIERVGKALEPLMLAMGLISPLATLPQIYKLYFSHSESAEGSSRRSGPYMVCITRTRRFGLAMDWAS